MYPIFGSVLRLAVLAPLLAACASSADFATADPAPSLAVGVAPERAVATLPAAAGRVVSVTERRDGEGLHQTITLAGDPDARGDDRIEVSTRAIGTASRPRVDEEAIAAELADALPGVDMTMTSRIVTIPSGPVGIATGRAPGGGACLYAWTETRAVLSPVRPTGLGPTLVGDERGTLSVRVRLCRRQLDEQHLIALAEGLRLSPELVAARPAAGTAATEIGRDALESAGYAAAAPLPTRSAQTTRQSPPPTPPRLAERPKAKAPARLPTAVEPLDPAAKVPASPIPLPSGG